MSVLRKDLLPAEKLSERLEDFIRKSFGFIAEIVETLRQLSLQTPVDLTGGCRHFVDRQRDLIPGIGGETLIGRQLI